MFSNGCAQKPWKLCERCQTPRTKPLRWHRSHEKRRRTSQTPSFRGQQAGVQGRGLSLKACFREVTGPCYNKHINMKKGGVSQANPGMASCVLFSHHLLTRHSNWSSGTSTIKVTSKQKARGAPGYGHLTQFPLWPRSLVT